jgi:Zn-dependent protease with chaperone function
MKLDWAFVGCSADRLGRMGRGWALAAALAMMLSGGAMARDGVEVGNASAFSRLVPAQEVESSAGQQYAQLLQLAREKNALASKDHPQVRRLRAIAQRIIPFTQAWNPRARDWQWEVNLIGSRQINAFCMPGGKIAFYSGLLEQLKLNDDEVAMVMGHEIAHALREHARERMGKNAVTNGAARVGGALAASIFGIDPRLTDGLARGGASKGAPPQWLSTHPSGSSRIAEIEANLPKVMPLYQRAKGNAVGAVTPR